MWLIIHINDILLMALSDEKSEDQVSDLTYMYLYQGFTLHIAKAIKEPTHSLNCLAFFPASEN